MESTPSKETLLHAGGAFPAHVSGLIGRKQVGVVMIDLAITLVATDNRLNVDLRVDHVQVRI